MGNFLTVLGGLIALITILGMLGAVGYALLHAVLFVKAVVDRLSNKEDDHYSKNIHQ